MLAFAVSVGLVAGLVRSADEGAFLEGERLGKLKLGQSAAEVITLLGEPKGRGKETEWAATGEWVQEWRYPAQGLTLNLAATSAGGDKTLLSVSATAPCQLATARGLRIGSPAGEVAKAYGPVEDKEQSVPGESFVAGSVYGGVIFTLREGKVAAIFLGAAAE